LGEKCEPVNENGSVVERLANYASVGKKDGSRAYSARRCAQVRPTARFLLTGSTFLGRMTDYQRDRVFAWFYSEKVVEHHPKIAHNRHERKTTNTVHGFSKLAWNSCDKGPANTVQTNTFLHSKLRSNRIELTCEPRRS